MYNYHIIENNLKLIKLKIMNPKLLLTIIFFSIITPIIAQNSDTVALKKLAYNETEAFRKRNGETWQSFITHDEQTNRSYSGDGFYYSNKGWNSFGPQLLQWLKDNPKPSMYTRIKNDNYVIRMNGNVAFMEYDQLSTQGTDAAYTVFTREYRTMIKDKNEWKITSLITIDSSSYTSADAMAVENKFNNIGYALLNNKKIKDAIEVFKLNVTLFPKSWNVYDSLGEAYANNGDTEEAVKNYEQSIQLNPQNDNGKKMLNKLKAK